jgi:type IV pilus assembly protein PilB
MSDKLCDLLVRKGKITKEQAKEAVTMQKKLGGNLVQVLSKLRLIKEEELAEILAKEIGVRMRRLHELVMSPNVSALLDLDIIEKHLVLPIEKKGNTLILVVSDPMDFDAIEEIRFLTSLDVETNVATRKDINAAIDHYFRGVPNDTLQNAEKGDSKKGKMESGKTIPAGADSLAAALAGLLLEKGVISKEELTRMLQTIQSKK